jgi:antirestriction protein ArdC
MVRGTHGRKSIMATSRAETAYLSEKSNLYATVTDQIVPAIEAGLATHSMPWQSVPGLPKNIASDGSYRGINTLLLWLIGNAKGYVTPYWATFKQWREMGHPVHAGEKSATVVFWKQLDRRDDASECSEASPSDGSRGPILARAYHVFNAAQVQGLALPNMRVLSEDERDERAEAFFGKLPIAVRHEGNQAFYSSIADAVHLPPFGLFKDANAYYATRGHECVHATGAKTRLDRDMSGRFGSEAYAMEELVAELGAAFLCADLGLSTEPRLDHAGYIESWLKVLKGDTRAIFAAAGKAQAAVDWLNAHQVAP